ncbi:MAG: hypothetical protein AAGC78_02065 [Cellvibrio sp.]|uniref:tetratricopeptide repeat protein n=1 Tax=Cellvibrio sp. TaxID=1965322 RepID=UPI0031AE8053
MSLLNDMLRDLSQHQKIPNEQSASETVNEREGEQRYLFNETRIAKSIPNRFLPSLLVFIVVLVLLFALKGAFFATDVGVNDSNPNSIDEASGSTNSVASSGDVEYTTSEKVQPKTELANKDSSVTTQQHFSEEPNLNDRLIALETAINQLSSVITHESTYQVAQEPMAVPYQGEPIASDLAATGSEDEDSFVGPSIVDTASLSIQDPFIETDSDSQLAENLAQKKAEPQLNIAPNVGSQDKQTAQSAEQLLAQGKGEQAVVLLQQFLIDAKQPRASLKTLLDIYSAREDVGRIEHYLSAADYLYPYERAFYLAKVALIKQQPVQAIDLLEMHLAEADNDENYRSLLAGLYQQTGRYLEAANHYHRLISTFGEKSTYWLGLALSQDALNQFQTARQAYQRVAQYELQPEVRSYIEKRLVALQALALQQ